MTFAGDAGARMPRVTIANVRTGESVELPFVPEVLTEEIPVEYVRQRVVGMSHTIMQYANTENYVLSGVEFALIGTPVENAAPSSQVPRPVDRQGQAIDIRRFMMSLCYPSVSAQGVRTGGPPRVLFAWPTLIALTCVVTNLRITHRKFDVRGTPMVSVAVMDLEEIRDVRLTSEVVRDAGTLRSQAAPTGLTGV